MTGPETPDGRWEFRVWLSPDDRLDLPAGWQMSCPEERTDLYILPPQASDVLPKIRGGDRFEIKRRIDRDQAFERWTVALSASFPLDANALETAATWLLDQSEAFPVSAGADADSFLAALLSVAPATLLRTVTKVPHKVVHDAIMAERTTVSVRETCQHAVTVAFESDHLARLKKAVEQAGLAGHVNRNYGAWLRGADA